MRYLAVSGLLAAALCAQQRETSTSVYDVNGRKVDWSTARSGDGRSSETVLTLNGRRVPLEQVEERLVSRQDGVQVVERLARRYDTAGNPLPPEKTVIETVSRPDGSATVTTTLYRGDLNGHLEPASREVAESRKSGATTLTETSVERRTINGTFEPLERRSASSSDAGGEVTVYRRDLNGRFAEAARQVARSSVANGEAVEQTDRYEVVDGRLRLARQEIASTRKTADGSEHKEIDVYGLAAPGKAISEDGKLQLRERQSYATLVGADGSKVEVFSVGRASLSDPGRVEAPRKVSETVTRSK